MEMDIRKVVEREFSELEIKARTEEENKELANLASLLDKFDHIDYVKSLQKKERSE